MHHLLKPFVRVKRIETATKTLRSTNLKFNSATQIPPLINAHTGNTPLQTFWPGKTIHSLTMYNVHNVHNLMYIMYDV